MIQAGLSVSSRAVCTSIAMVMSSTSPVDSKKSVTVVIFSFGTMVAITVMLASMSVIFSTTLNNKSITVELNSSKDRPMNVNTITGGSAGDTVVNGSSGLGVVGPRVVGSGVLEGSGGFRLVDARGIVVVGVIISGAVVDTESVVLEVVEGCDSVGSAGIVVVGSTTLGVFIVVDEGGIEVVGSRLGKIMSPDPDPGVRGITEDGD